MTRLFGAHVSSAGGLENALRSAKTLGINTIQIHPSPPQRWNYTPFKTGVEDAFEKEKPESGVTQVFFHAIYLINLANPQDQPVTQAKKSLINYLDLCARIDAQGVIVHVGSMKDQPSDEAGFDRAASAIDEILENSPANSRLILEVAAGAGRVVGSKLHELRAIYDRVTRHRDRLGYGLDTQHMWASGYNLRDELETCVSDIEKHFGFEKVWSVHLNDSMTELGSKKDRHANIGEGLIGAEALKRIFLHDKLKDIPFILETPALKSLETAGPEVEKLRSFVGST